MLFLSPLTLASHLSLTTFGVSSVLHHDFSFSFTFIEYYRQG